MKKSKHKPGLLWITGLSGSGKTTISNIIYNNLQKNYSNIILLDGDVLRKKLKIKSSGSFSNNYRTKVGLKYVNLCKRYVNNRNKFVIIATMALISKVQNEYKKIKNNFDIFLDVPIKELRKRDPKKLYKKFENKKINNMVGLDIKYDKPHKPSLYIKWKKSLTAFKISKKILELIKND
jgi:adenylylsulfate kinase|tara:strand:+ start:4334 stop:4870 length:537 start_codon:yes stop_codon:yes gene_type:complete